ncbi:substrate-binding periplasmic protein [Pseudoalteromonas shioyasakiensis]|uniref:substrate-binding periplasmic protein n=1 Tax=Pseudoalteromonas shioyasakiensis TaxID=1190813 RepID=UPI001EFD7A45|nr:transporter substrate-binding domain-containing protein [Pseudoalteromonas shioyasakiensis]MCG9735089.1 transporter substrate-binding domain-containing protein [Pseudoalteromonas shioyasakiensis]MDK9685258.1 transporter substrate-binding domain-containing protein [Pseudoalteromonas shioyasakiensis]
MSRAVVFLLLFLIVPLVRAETLRVALYDTDYPPYHLVSGKQKGLVDELLERFAEQYKLKTDYILVPEVRSQHLLDEGKVDVRLESEQWYRGGNQYYWSDSIAVVEDILVMPRGCHIPAIDELGGYVLMARFGYTYPQFEALFASGKLHREDFYSELDMLKALVDIQQNQRVAVIAKNTLQWYASKNNAFKKLTVSDYSVGKAPMQLQFAYNEKGKRISEQFNEFMKNLKSSGEFAKIESNYQ